MNRARVVVVGAGLAGTRTVAELRALGVEGPLVLCGVPDDSTDRPPLSKEYLRGEVDASAIALDELADDPHVVRRGPVATIHADGVELRDGERWVAPDVVVATGADARRLPGPERADVLTLRSRADSDALRAALDRASRLVIVGGGFVGAEVASVARARGIEVDVVEQQDEMFGTTLGAELGRRVRELHEADGVTVHRASRVHAIDGAVGAPVVVLDDGSRLAGDVVLVGVGARPVTDVLPDVELADGGLPCDTEGRVVGRPGLWAVGDVAAWTDAVSGRRVRREHWAGAGDHATLVAHAIAGVEPPPGLTSLPYFWSDQASTKIQVLGRPELADTTTWRAVEGLPDRTVLEYRRDATLVGAAVVGAPRMLGRLRRELALTEQELLIKENT